MSLHDDIMNLPAPRVPPIPLSGGEAATKEDRAYKEGHRDARHAAAELALKADAEIERLRELAEHLRHCRWCGEMDVHNCHEGVKLWDLAMTSREI